jgi:mannose-6-phosphate isomerase-like protein (cupin superfamily)
MRVESLPKFPAGEGTINRACVQTDGASIQFTWVAAGAPLVGPTAERGKPDRHWFDQTHIVISGRLAMTLYSPDGEETTYEVGAGELLYIPGDVPHTGRSLGDEPVYAIEIFAPPRADYRHMVDGHQPGLPPPPAA